MEAECSSETLVPTYKPIRRHKPNIDILTAVRTSKLKAFWDIVPCSLVEVRADRRFRDAYSFHHGDNCRRSTHLWNVDLLLRDCTRHIPAGCPLPSHSVVLIRDMFTTLCSGTKPPLTFYFWPGTRKPSLDALVSRLRAFMNTSGSRIYKTERHEASIRLDILYPATPPATDVNLTMIRSTHGTRHFRFYWSDDSLHFKYHLILTLIRLLKRVFCVHNK
jgi:hypothetical protein